MTDAQAPETEETQEPERKSKKKLLIAVFGGVVLLSALGGLGVYMGLLDSLTDSADPNAPKQAQQKSVVFYDLPEMTVNLATDDRRTFLKVRIALEVESYSVVSDIEPYLPRIMDAFQIYLRELRPADLEGSAGLFRLKEQLLRRINLAVYPAKVDGVLFKEILIQ
ncbi:MULTISPECIES: flagellar basal body-associated FliL family protein [Pseudovibrio]|uniref:flagellar basal body-associated FliL family protein n=1 Tax=Stappiaceae TaxID=2821832 RepID=UPI002366452F|nr:MULTISPECIES: flagellar basal body-associated FliL family protein [Pseudovibrio]MDD7910440.1 flagellar basal body-associated FliL family protein [Pseudovibrio exalbescens]MDX5594155.1 flagellar basal body-associated FliL family protein [Pseudovibrio sp. SPO723]